MSLVNSFVRALALVTLLISSTAAQTCYFPNGDESSHTPCKSSGSSSCCGASDSCMDNGLCFGGGVVSRGSCTDKNWNSEECAQYCYDVSRNSSIPITACTNDGADSKFMCGVNAANCKKNSTIFTIDTNSTIVLRPSELAALVDPAVSSALAQTTTQAAVQTRITVTATPTSNPDAIYTPGQMAGLGVGLSVPLLIASIAALLLWRRDRARTPKLMYPLPDDMQDAYTAKDGRPLHGLHPGAGSLRPPVSRDGSELSFSTMASSTPAHLQTFAERYQVMKGAGGFQIQRVELDASPAAEYGEHEMHDLKVPIPKEF